MGKSGAPIASTKPELTNYDGHWIDTATYRSYGVAFSGGLDEAGRPSEQAAAELPDLRDTVTPHNYSAIAADFGKLQRLAAANNVNIRVVRGSGYFYILEDTKTANQPETLKKDQVDLIKNFDTFRQIGSEMGDDLTRSADKDGPIFSPNYFQAKIVQYATGFGDKDMAKKVVAGLVACKEASEALIEISTRIDEKFTANDANNPVTIEDLKLFDEKMTVYKEAYESLGKIASQGETATTPDFVDEDPQPRVIE